MLETRVRSLYEPHSKQKPFHNARYRSRFRACICGTGSGKTVAGAFESMSWLMGNPNCVGYAFEPTFPMVKRILLPTLESELILGYPLEKNPLVTNFNKGDYCITFINNSKLWLGSLDNPERAEGPNVDFIWVDEARLIRNFELAWRVIVRRLRGSGVGSKIGAWITTTPPSPGPLEKPTPIYKFFEHPKYKDIDATVYRWSIFDNPHLDDNYLESMKRQHTGQLGKRFLQGLFVEIGAGSFNIDSTIHVDKYAEYCPASFREILFGVDFGWTNPACIIVVGVDGDGRAFCIDELYQSRLREQDLFKTACEFVTKYGDGKFICDRSEPRTIKYLKTTKIIDDVEYIGVKAKPDKSKRDSGIRALGGRFDDAGDGRPRIFIHPRCVNLISELQIYNESKKENDHAVDALRYALASLSSQPAGEISIEFGRRPR